MLRGIKIMESHFYLNQPKGKVSAVKRFIAVFLILTVSFTQIIPSVYAQSINPLNLPVPGTMVMMSESFVPVLLKGMTINPHDPFHFDFIVDSGNSESNADQIKIESDRLIKYFMASMTVPKNDLWVNLSPNEKDRIIPNELGKTELGRDLLAQDYILKQLSSSLMYPESELGKKFWEEVYKQAQDKFGVNDIPLNTFNKVWILPESASVYEHGNSVYITESHLKVMMDEDYKSSDKWSVVSGKEKESPSSSLNTYHLPLTTQIMKEIILPAIEKEVNTGKNFAPLRQIYHSLILAKWYKETVRQSILSQVYIDQNKVSGIETNDPLMKERIYERYMEAYKKGVYDYMKEEYDALSQTVIPRKYFSGGFVDQNIALKRTDAAQIADKKVGNEFVVGVDVRAEGNGMTRRQFLKTAGAVVAGGLLGKVNPEIARADDLEDSINNLIIQKLEDKNEYVRKEAVDLLVQSGDKRATEILILSLKKETHSYVQLAIVEALGKLKDKKAVEPIIELFGDLLHGKLLESPNDNNIDIYDMQKAIFNSLVQIGGDDVINFFILQLDPENSSGFVKASIKALNQLGLTQEEIINRKLWLKHLLRNSLAAGTVISGGAYYYWSRYTVSGNLRRLKSENKDVRIAAIEALGNLGDKRAVELLIERLGDREIGVRRAVAEALKKFGVSKEQMVNGYINALKSDYSDARGEAADELGVLGDERAVDPLIESLRDGKAGGLFSAGKALVKIVDLELLSKLIKEYPIFTRIAFFELLKRFNSIEELRNYIRNIDQKMEVEVLVRYKIKSESVVIGADIIEKAQAYLTRFGDFSIYYSPPSYPIYAYSAATMIDGNGIEWGIPESERTRTEVEPGKEEILLIGKPGAKYFEEFDPAQLSTPNQVDDVLTRSVLNVLQYREELPSQINDIVILGNYNFDTYREALRIYRKNKDSRIVLTGGRGRFIEEAIKITERFGVTVADKENVSEAKLIYGVMQKIIETEDEFKDLQSDFKSGRMKFKLETSSNNTPKNLQNYREILVSENKLNQENYNVVFIQTPHQQLRSKATFDKEFAGTNVKGVSHTVEFNRQSFSRYDTVKELLGEAWRIILYSQERGNGTIDLSKSYENGLNGIDPRFWQSAEDLFKGLYVGEQRALAKHLILLLNNTSKEGSPLTFADIEKDNGQGKAVGQFIQLIKSALNLPSEDQWKELVEAEINKAAQKEGLTIGPNTKVALFIGGQQVADGYYYKLASDVLRNKLDLVYLPMPVDENDQGWLNVIKNQISENDRIISAVVTRPWKEAMFENGDNQIGAVNYVIKRDGKLLRSATDGPAWVEGLKKDLGNDYDFQGKNIVILGSGGAARELAEVLKGKGIQRITFTEVKEDKSDALKVMIGSLGVDYEAEFLVQDDISLAQRFREADIIVNATGIGRQDTSGQSPVNAKYFQNVKPGLIVSDLISDTDTQILQDARRMGIQKTFYGKSMFIYGMVGFMQGWLKSLNPDDQTTDDQLFDEISSWLEANQDAAMGIEVPNQQKLTTLIQHDNPALADWVPVAIGAGIDEKVDPAMLQEILSAAANHPEITEIISLGAGIPVAYQIWSRYTIRGNLFRLRVGDVQVRSDAIKFLGKSKDPKILDLLINLLRDKERLVKKAAAEALGQIKDLRALQPLIETLKNYNDDDVRKSIVEALGNIGDKRAVDPLLESLRDINWKYSIKVIESLGKLGDKRAIDPLLEVLRSGNSALHQTTIEALKKLQASKDHIFDGLMNALKKAGNSGAREKVIEELGKLGDKRAVVHLLKVFSRDRDPHILIAAAHALSKLGNPTKLKLINEIFNKLQRGGVPKSKQYEKLFQILKLRQEGYDFEFEYESEIAHYEENEYADMAAQYGTVASDVRVVDRPERFEIFRGKKLTDPAQLSDEIYQALPVGLIGALHDKVTSVFHGQINDISFVDQPLDAAINGINLFDQLSSLANEYPLTTITMTFTAVIVALGGLTQLWIMYLESNYYRFKKFFNESGIDPQVVSIALENLESLETAFTEPAVQEHLKFVSEGWAGTPSNAAWSSSYETLGELRFIGNRFSEEVVRSFENKTKNFTDEDGEHYVHQTFEITSAFNKSRLVDFLKTLTPENAAVRIQQRIINPKVYDETLQKPVKDSASLSDVGGIDMNNIEVKKDDNGHTIQFDPVQIDSVMKNNIQGFVPVIINITPINSVLPILGLQPRKPKEEYKVSQLN